jgi:Helix-turn-helix domain
MRSINDPREIRALTHPVRMDLLEVLVAHGPLTATQAGELIGESPTTCSFHFRQLAKYGFVEEAGPAAGRNRPWKLVVVGMRFEDSPKDTEVAVATNALTGLLFQRVFNRLENWRRTQHSYPAEWREAAETNQTVIWLTPDELREIQAEIETLLQRHHERLTDPALRPEGARLVEGITAFYPIELGQAHDGPPHDGQAHDGQAPGEENEGS